MAQIHAATSSPRARELVDVVLAELDRWLELKYPEGTVLVTDPTADDAQIAGRYAVLDIREELADHLVIPIGVTLAAWEAADG